MEWSRRVEYHIFLIYQKLTVQDFNFQLFGILRISTIRFGGSPLLYFTFYSNLSGRGVYCNNDDGALCAVRLGEASLVAAAAHSAPAAGHISSRRRARRGLVQTKKKTGCTCGTTPKGPQHDNGATYNQRPGTKKERLHSIHSRSSSITGRNCAAGCPSQQNVSTLGRKRKFISPLTLYAKGCSKNFSVAF